MKRVSLNIDLDDNEIFDKEVTNIIKGKIREIVRNDIQDLVKKEAADEIERLFNGNSWDYRNKLSNIVKDTVREEIKSVINHTDVHYIANKAVEEHSDYIIATTTTQVEKKCNQVLERTVNERVKEKLKDVFNFD